MLINLNYRCNRFFINGICTYTINKKNHIICISRPPFKSSNYSTIEDLTKNIKEVGINDISPIVKKWLEHYKDYIEDL